MNTIFSDFSKDVDLSIFRESNKDPKTPLRRHYLSLVGLLEYVDILNGGLPGCSLPEGMTVDDVKRMVSHAINDLDTKEAMSTDSSLPEHDYVDLRLPSGTLWATENIKDADGNDLYFAWGETHGYTAEQVGSKEEGKRPFTHYDYEFGISNPFEIDYGMKKYNGIDGLMELEPKDDAATVNWGEEWKIPTIEQFEELNANTKYEWVEIDGVQGGKFTSKVEGYTDKFLFFPAVGRATDGKIERIGYKCNYWSASLDGNEADGGKTFDFTKSTPGASIGSLRKIGCPIRPVRIQANQIPEDSQNAQGTQGTQGTEGTQGA